MSFGSRKTVPFFTVLIVCSLLSYKAYCLEKEPIPVDRNAAMDLPLSEEASDLSVDLATVSTDGFSKPITWGTDITISTGPVYGGISTDYDVDGNVYAARCSTYLDSINAMVRVYKSTDDGTSWFYLCGFIADQGSFKYSRPTVLTGSVGNKLYVLHWRSTQNGDIGMARFTQDGTHEGFYTVKSGLDTLSYFTACTNMGRGDTIVVVYQRDLPGGIPYIYFTVSTDFGEHWSLPVLIDGYAEHPDIAYGQEGNLYLVYNHTGVNDIAFLRGETSGGWTEFELLTDDGNSVHEDYPEVAALHTFPADTATVWVVYNCGGSGHKSDGTELRFAYSTNSGVDWTENQTFGAPPRMRETGPTEFLDFVVQPCDTALDTLWGGTTAAYYWTQPTVDQFINMRFEMPGDHGGRLEEIQIALYQGGSVGTPDPDLYVWSSDGVYPLDSSPPAGAIGAFHMDYDSVVWFPSYNLVPTWDQGIDFAPGEKFHIGVSHAYDPGDTLALLSDDGSMGTDRSSGWDGGAWGTYGPYEFLINAVICPYPPVEPCDTTLDTLWGGTSAFYYWQNPTVYGDMYLNERFDLPVNHGGRLEEIQVGLYQSGTLGTPDPELYVWLSDGVYPLDGNPPDGAISAFHVDYDSIIWFPSYTAVESWYRGIEFDPGESFHIGVGHAYVDGDTLGILSDDGSSGSNRSVEWAQPGQWGTMVDDWGYAVDFFINAVICPSAPLDLYDKMAADLSAYRSPACSTVSLCYLSSMMVREPALDIYHTWAHSSSPGQFHAPHDKISDHLAYWSPDGQEVCQMTFSADPDPLPGIVYAGYPPLKNGAWSLYFDQVSWTDVEEERAVEELPEQFSLSFNYPNPFNPTTKIKYTVGTSQARSAIVSLRIYNVLGELVRTLVDEPKSPGTYEIRWDGRDQEGNEVASGIYFCKLQAGDFSQTRKMVLVK